MKRKILLLIAAMAAILFLPATALAAENTSDSFMLRVGGTTTIAPTEQLDTVIVIDGDAVIDGTIDDTLWVVSGDAVINGQVNGDITVIDGTLTLGPTANVHDVTLMRSDLTRDPAAVVTGDVSERSELVNFGWGDELFSFAFWIGSTIALLVAGLVVTALLGRRVTAAANTLTARPVESLVFAILLWIALPVLGVISILTIIGIPLGLMLLLSFPIIWMVGYTVAGARLGAVITPRLSLGGHPERPFWEVAAGIIAFQLIGLVPFIGGVVVGLAGFIGSGAIVYLAYRSRSERRASATPTIQGSATPAN